MPDRIPDYTLFILPDGSFMCRECMRQEGVRPTLPGLMRYYPRRESLPVGCKVCGETKGGQPPRRRDY
jgi:hypothetical protein